MDSVRWLQERIRMGEDYYMTGTMGYTVIASKESDSLYSIEVLVDASVSQDGKWVYL